MECRLCPHLRHKVVNRDHCVRGECLWGRIRCRHSSHHRRGAHPLGHHRMECQNVALGHGVPVTDIFCRNLLVPVLQVTMEDGRVVLGCRNRATPLVYGAVSARLPARVVHLPSSGRQFGSVVPVFVKLEQGYRTTVGKQACERIRQDIALFPVRDDSCATGVIAQAACFGDDTGMTRLLHKHNGGTHLRRH